MCKHVERSQSKRPRLLAIHGRHDNRCISDQICNRSINRTSNLEFLYAVARYDRDRRSSASIRSAPCPIFFSSLFFFFPRCFDFVMRCFRSIPTGIFCVFAVGFIFESELNKFRKGFLPKEGGKRSICIDCGTFHRIKAYIFAGKDCQIASTRCNCAIMFLTRFSF